MARAYVALGGNLDDPRAHLTRAFAELSVLPQTRLIARSALYASVPVGYLNQPDFINAVAALDTALSPEVLLQELLQIEQRHGRYREFPNAPRTLDLDLLLYDGRVLQQHGLTLPHPRMHERAFVLAPLVEIAPLCMIPGRGSAAELLAQLHGQTLEKLDAA